MSLTLALSKGRILEDTLPLLQKIDIKPTDDLTDSRKLQIDTNDPNLKLIIVRATDVPTYVEYGAADLGVAGKDVLLEHNSPNLYEPLDLKIAKCKLMVAGRRVAGKSATHRLRIATKFVNIAKQYYAQMGQQVELIKLYGSMELAPILGLSDKIVDVVDTGNTLKANDLEAEDLIMHISARLIVNQSSMKVKNADIQSIIKRLSEVI